VKGGGVDGEVRVKWEKMVIIRESGGAEGWGGGWRGALRGRWWGREGGKREE